MNPLIPYVHLLGADGAIACGKRVGSASQYKRETELVTCPNCQKRLAGDARLRMMNFYKPKSPARGD